MSAKQKKKILITSALPYVNNVPHLGNIVGCVLSADVFARFNRLIGNETLFISGTDEHGTATEAKAIEECLTPKQICDKYNKIHKEIYDWFNISFDIFGRTSDPEHKKITQEIFLKLYENGYIVEEEIEQLYCRKEDKFLADRFVEGTCPHCGYADARGDQCDKCQKLLDPKELINPRCKLDGTTPEIKKTKHLFIDLEKLQPKLEEWVKKTSKEGAWTQNAITTTNAWFKEGLKKRAITRDLRWGIPVPLKGYEHKVFYVWFDAPIGYMSITSKRADWQDWWKNPENVLLYQFMAKDNIPFHTIVFPATLIGTNETYTMLHHIDSTEYLQYEGGKFSKSRALGVFGDGAKNSGISSDAFRYYLLINRPENADSDFSWKELGERINNELVANLGNFVNRTTSFLNANFDGKIGRQFTKEELDAEDKEFIDKIIELEKKIKEDFNNIELKSALKKTMDVSHLCNQYFQKSEPWKTIKENKSKCEKNLFVLANVLKDLALLIEPFMPLTSESIFKQLNLEKKNWNDLGKLDLFDHKINPQIHLFKKIEENEIESLKKRFFGTCEDVSQKTQNKHTKTIDTKSKTSVLEKIKIPEDFSALNLKVAKILSCKNHPDAEKLFVLELDLGDKENKRQLVAGLRAYYSPEEIVGKHIVIVSNLKPAKLRGVESQGMLLAAEKDGVVKVLEAKTSWPGEQVFAGKYVPISNQIEYADFAKIKMTIKNKSAVYDDLELKTKSGSVLCDIGDGATIR